MSMKLLRAGAVVVLFVLLAALVTLMLPVREWRTGREALPPLALEPGGRFAEPAGRLWIDSDAACGSGARRDPDDFFAILLLAGADEPRIAGISSVFGNAPLEVTDRTLRQLAGMLAPSPIVHAGASAPAAGGSGDTPAARALRAALAEAPLEIVALGPLTNIAAALRGRPDLQRRVTRIVAVMGRRPGHAFHPAEGARGANLFGHGPLFRDLNFTSDPGAVAEVLGVPVPLVLLPYDAARHIELTEAFLRGMASRGGARAWVARQAQGWLDYWREDIGREGFYPFDLMAAAFALRPALLRCAKVPVHIGEDATFFALFGDAPALVAQPGSIGASAVFCPDVDAALHGWLAARLGARACRPTSDGSGC
jgi:inosine-uridine nucleoside N-ribohydrolase